MDKRRKTTLFLLVSGALLSVGASDDAIAFPDSSKSVVEQKSATPGIQSKEGAKPRFGFDAGGMSSSVNFGVQPNGGGVSGSASFSGSYGGQGHSGSQSQSFNFQAGNNGFSASQSASQSSSFNSGIGGGNSISGSQASSQASSFSGGNGGHSGSSASSQAASFGFQGNGVNVGGSSSSSNGQSFSGGQHGGSSGGFGFPNEYLSPDYIRGYFPGARRNSTSQRRRKPNNWFTQTYLLNRKGSVVFRS